MEYRVIPESVVSFFLFEDMAFADAIEEKWLGSFFFNQADAAVVFS